MQGHQPPPSELCATPRQPQHSLDQPLELHAYGIKQNPKGPQNLSGGRMRPRRLPPPYWDVARASTAWHNQAVVVNVNGGDQG